MNDGYAKPWQALLLAWTAGFVDGLGFVTLDGIFTSHISGNSVTVGVLIAQRRWPDVLLHLNPVLAFGLGIVLGTVLEKVLEWRGIRHRFSAVLGLEAALLLAFLAASQPIFAAAASAPAPFYLVTLLAGAMGVQSVSLRRVHGEAVNTPFVSGMFLKAVENSTLWALRHQETTANPEAARESIRRLLFYGSLWGVFVLGAVSGGLGHQYFRALALLLPLAVLVFLMGGDWLRPVRDSEAA